ncbi:MAG: hypothetical protein M1355_02550, partial [Patescibacteria group bacterium]|nr:hypothetical protein [Patescibacteria group bacterium]
QLLGLLKKAIELLKQLPSWVGEGKEDIKKIRIHVIEKPLTSYLECEIACYKHWNIPIVGEDVYLVDKEKLGGMWLPAGDTLIFDNKNVIENIYDERGFCTGAKIIEDKEELKPYLEMKENLMKGKLEEV